MQDKLKHISRFTRGLFSSIYLCFKNRNKAIIIVTPADLSTVIDGKRTSPFAFALQQKLWESKKIESLIILRSYDYTTNYNFDFSIHNILALGGKLKCISIFWKLIVKLLSPKVVFAIDWDTSLNKSCNTCNIPLYYIQHGVIVADHMYFGKNAIKDIEKSKLPSGILCWDKESALNFSNIFPGFAIGNLWNNVFITNNKSIQRIKNEYQIENKNSKPSILLTLTWGSHFNSFISEKIIKAIKQTCNNYNWLIRLHPVVYKSELLSQQFDNFLKKIFTNEEYSLIQWDHISTMPLPLLLSYVTCHITIESSVVIEAAQFGVPSLIINSKVIEYGPNGENTPPYGGPSYFKLERELGYATVCTEELIIENWIIENSKINKKPLIDLNLHNNEWERFIENIIR